MASTQDEEQSLLTGSSEVHTPSAFGIHIEDTGAESDPSTPKDELGDRPCSGDHNPVDLSLPSSPESMSERLPKTNSYEFSPSVKRQLLKPLSPRFTPFWWRGVFSICFILIILICSYIGFVICMCLPLLRSHSHFAFTLTALITFHVVFVLEILAFLRSVFGDPGAVPLVAVSAANHPHSYSYCDHCDHQKPQRTHHCSKCMRCVTKMDHHCPWINNCVGWGNYKFFLLACTYCSLLGLVSFVFCFLRYFLIGLPDKWDALTIVKEIMIGGTCVGGLFFFVLIGLYVMNHYYLASQNLSSIEYWRAKSEMGHSFEDCCSRWCPIVTGVGGYKSEYNIGTCRNLMEIFGYVPCFWCLPIANMPGDGVSYPMRLLDSNTRVRTDTSPTGTTYVASSSPTYSSLS